MTRFGSARLKLKHDALLLRRAKRKASAILTGKLRRRLLKTRRTEPFIPADLPAEHAGRWVALSRRDGAPRVVAVADSARAIKDAAIEAGYPGASFAYVPDKAKARRWAAV